MKLGETDDSAIGGRSAGSSGCLLENSDLMPTSADRYTSPSPCAMTPPTRKAKKGRAIADARTVSTETRSTPSQFGLPITASPTLPPSVEYP